MSQVPSSTRTAYTTPTYADGSKNSNTQSKPASTGTSLSASDVTVSRQAYSQAKFDSYETMDRNSLKKKGVEILDQLYIAGSKKANDEVPDSDDPVRLARAKQATDFVCGQSGTNFKSSAKNPFAGMSRESLTKIMYDDSGTYTINERAAAGSEQQRQDYNYWSPIISDSFMSGDCRKHYRAAIEFYDKLSPIEKSFAPVGYRENVVNWLKKEEERLEKLDDVNTAQPLVDSAKKDKIISNQLFSGEKSLYGWMNTLVQAEQAMAKNAAQPPVEKGKEPTDSIFRVTWNSVIHPVKKLFQ
ncbi:hypothetical protein BXU06_02915 [Aquaspirillum sp. LM1]|uniref:hypothetical protein n=1 Tax=Aquaspirillum sp. LM1 TaxID=1938604 RepID=UPI000983ADFC|nr:hypothetical protein [Aquaspirillum sp. LM1]AQR64120.1 hypothetical protein BXU06_02915 [Aquaspirillum sp. LM1]